MRYAIALAVLAATIAAPAAAQLAPRAKVDYDRMRNVTTVSDELPGVTGDGSVALIGGNAGQTFTPRASDTVSVFFAVRRTSDGTFTAPRVLLLVDDTTRLHVDQVKAGDATFGTRLTYQPVWFSVPVSQLQQLAPAHRIELQVEETSDGSSTAPAQFTLGEKAMAELRAFAAQYASPAP